MAKQWRCFFCDEVFTNSKDAYDHFGDESVCGSDVPACVDPLRADEKALMKEFRSAVKLAREGMHHEERADELEWDLRQVEVTLQKHFGDDCTTLWQACDRYKNLQFELKVAREEIDALKNSNVAA
jgi:hypothetical protein